jgi:hypothetical protein
MKLSESKMFNERTLLFLSDGNSIVSLYKRIKADILLKMYKRVRLTIVRAFVCTYYVKELG